MLSRIIGTAVERLSTCQDRTEVRWRPVQEASLAPPCMKLRSFGSKCSVLEKAYLRHCSNFRRPRWFGARGIFSPCPHSVRSCFLQLHQAILVIINKSIQHLLPVPSKPLCQLLNGNMASYWIHNFSLINSAPGIHFSGSSCLCWLRTLSPVRLS